MEITTEPKHLLIQIQELHCDSKIGKDRHFIAADRKGSYGKKLGIIVVLINVLIGSTLINLISVDAIKQVVLSVFSLSAAALAAVHTFLNFSKDVENHRKIGNMYLETARDADNLISRYKDAFINRDQCQNEYDLLLKNYKAINKEEEICPNPKKDYNKAFGKNKEAKERIKKLKQESNYKVES